MSNVNVICLQVLNVWTTCNGLRAIGTFPYVSTFRNNCHLFSVVLMISSQSCPIVPAAGHLSAHWYRVSCLLKVHLLNSVTCHTANTSWVTILEYSCLHPPTPTDATHCTALFALKIQCGLDHSFQVHVVFRHQVVFERLLLACFSKSVQTTVSKSPIIFVCLLQRCVGGCYLRKVCECTWSVCERDRGDKEMEEKWIVK